MSSPDHPALLERALAAAVPAFSGWGRDRGPDGWCRWWTDAPSPAAAARRLEVELRSDGDADVRLHYRDPLRATGRGPAEAHFLVASDGEERVADALAAIAHFVADLVDERLVLALARGWFRGGREFVAPDAITPAGRRRLDRVVSWRGSYDWTAAPGREAPRGPWP